MPTQPLSDAVLQEAVDTVQQAGSVAAAARLLERPVNTMRSRIAMARNRNIRPTGFSIKPLPDEDLPVDIIRSRRKEQFNQLVKAKTAKLLIPVQVKLDGPIGISIFGDPHLDDNGTDLGKIERHVDIVKRTEGLFASNIGDAINNWTGRLARLYSEQSTSAKEAWALCEWFVRELPWLIFLGGNHGAWSGAGDPVKWMLANCQSIYDNYAARLELQFPNGKRVRVNCRHDFAGHSMYNTAHGAMKAALNGWRDHLLLCGHKHTSGYGVLKDPSNGLVTHAIRVSSYKTFDRYADELGLPNQDIFANVVVIVDPRYADDDPRLLHVCFDPEQGADYLTWLRSKL